MIIILEGPDGSGKSELAKKFASANYRVLHNLIPSETVHPFESCLEYIRTFNDPSVDPFYASRNLKPVTDFVFDRFHLSEWVYGNVMRGHSKLSLDQIRIINLLLQSVNAVTIFCLPFFSTVEANWKARKQSEYVQDVEKLRAVYQKYHDLLPEFSGMLHMVYDYEHQDIPKIASGIPGF